MRISVLALVVLIPVAMLVLNACPPEEPTDSGSVRINEFLASNTAYLQDEDDDFSDWIELYNSSDTAINLSGYYLSDSVTAPTKWAFPSVSIPADSYLIVYASGKDRTPTNGQNLHTNFKLSSSGESVVLTTAAASRTTLTFSGQRQNVSYGLAEDGSTYKFWATPSPGRVNSGDAYIGLAAEPQFSQPAGFYSGSQPITLSSASPGVTIRYTTDTTEPTASIGTIANGPITVDQNTVLRAIAYSDDYYPSYSTTATYLIDATAAQASLPVISLVGDAEESLYEPNGIMAISGGYYGPNATYGGVTTWLPELVDDYHYPIAAKLNEGTYERPVSIELIQPDTYSGFQANCGIRIHGGSLLRLRTERVDGPWDESYSKFSFRLYFRNQYGPDQLNYEVFPGSSVVSFERLVLRGGHNDQYNPFIKDELVRRLYTDMGQVSSHGILVNLFVNGDYKSYYNLVERLDDVFMKYWFDDDADYEVVDSGNVADVDDINNVHFNQLVWTAKPNPDETPEQQQQVYDFIAARLKIKNFIDYVILELYTANDDWPLNNMVAARKSTDGGQWGFFIWDVESSMKQEHLNANGLYQFPIDFEGGGSGLYGEQGPVPWLFQRLMQYSAFRTTFAERLAMHFGAGGALSQTNLQARFAELEAEMSTLVPDFDTYIADTWIPQREAIFLAQMQAEGLY